MPPLKPLCEHCAKIPLLDSKNATEGLFPSMAFSLGSGARILDSDCPFCRVIVTAFQTGYQTDTVDNTTPLSARPDVSLYWRPKSGPGSRSAFNIDLHARRISICVALPSSNQRPASNHEYFQPVVEAEFNVSRLNDWISTCEGHHLGRCRAKTASFEDSFPGLETVRFIDVEQSSIVELRTVPDYVALSYVWGESPAIRLTTASRASLSLSGGIKKAWKSIPRTIKDAIDLVRKLGVRYLWVDALCLIQNDPDDVSRGVRIMDEIYERSWLTIVAASGHDANAGLPGVREGSRCRNTAIPVTEDVSVGIFVPLDRLLNCSVYETRAWTFQEQLLARRAVYFVAGRVYFRCRLDVYAEHVVDQRPRGSREHLFLTSWASTLSETAELKEPLRSFANILSYYSQRALTFPSDALRALDGITRRVSQLSKCHILQGIPTAAFDAFLIFERDGHGILRRRPGFPSYSWAGWKGRLTVPLYVRISIFEYLNRWLEERTWIIWYKRNPSGVLSLVWDPSANESFPLDNFDYPGYRKRQPFDCPAEVFVNSARTYPTEDLASNSIPETPYPLLQFWTLSVHFPIQLKDDFTGGAHIISTNGLQVGSVSLDGVEQTTIFTSQDTFEFILLSRTMDPRPNCRGEMRYFVMLLEWHGPVAERRGIGRLQIHAVADSFPPGPKWKEIILG
ncbi:Heterokaryon incompatibility domain-containing protein [Madurella fahalii]|uniref:Heterokaryon incompatibility domain-containing protein n=1 Tax=Madurella fahalii TaxID=1157608 RepID=A0ABQ0GL89_9PEZI